MYERFIVAAITFSISLFGTIANLIVLLSTLRMSSMNSSFGIITKNQAICNLLMCLIFLIYMFPMQLSGSKALIEFSHYVGLATLSVYEVSNQSHLLIAVNRFCAVFVPNHYERLFSKFGTLVMMNVIWTSSMVMCVLVYEIFACYTSYDVDSWTLLIPITDFCIQMTWYSDFLLNNSLAIGTLLINLITAYKAGRKSRMLMDAAGMKMSKQQRRREIIFIRQAFFQGTTIFTGQVTYFLIAPLVSNAVFLFFLASLWAFMHAVEGGIILASNEEMRTVAFKKREKRKTTIIVATVSAN